LRTYEALYIVKPDVADDDVQTIANEVESLATENGGATVRSEVWGKRRLAYDVKGYSEGVYILLRFTAEAEAMPRLERYFRLSETVIRHLVVLFDEKTLRLEAEQQRRKEEEIQASAEETRRRELRGAQRAAQREAADEIVAPTGDTDDLTTDDDQDGAPQENDE